MSVPQTRPQPVPDVLSEVPAAPVRIAPSVARRVRVSVDNNHCHHYGICQQEAPDMFDLGIDGRLRYQPRPDARTTGQVEQAARCCPMQAVTVEDA